MPSEVSNRTPVGTPSTPGDLHDAGLPASPVLQHEAPSLKYRPDIDGLRAIAILTVVAFHAFPDLAPGGFTGVDVFFVISGYLISTIIMSGLNQGKFSFLEFYSRRARRIFPSLALILIVTVTLGSFDLLPDEFAALGKHAAAGAGFIANIVFWKESGYFDAASTTKLLLHLWSLGIEEQFYIVWPLLLFATWRLRSTRLPMLLALAIASFAVNIHVTPIDAATAFYSPLPRFWELLAGCILAHVALFGCAPMRLSERSAGALLVHTAPGVMLAFQSLASVLGIVLIAVGVCSIDRAKAFPGWWVLLPVAGAFVLIAVGPKAWVNRTLLSRRPMVWIGLISFQLYLWHWPLLVFTRMFEAGNPSVVARAAAAAASFPLAWLTYAYVDKPIRTGRKARVKTIVVCAVLFATGIGGCVIYALGGVPSRFPEAVRNIAAFKYDYPRAYRTGTCFLRSDQDQSQFGACTEIAPIHGARSVYLWGDSHAAHLYPGLHAAAHDRFDLTQLTASLCPPLMDVDIAPTPHCRAINAYVFARIAAQRPDVVILAARWVGYDWRKIVVTIDRLSRAGIRRVIVVGPVPMWHDSLPIALYRYFKGDFILHRLPPRMRYGLNPGIPVLDQNMADLLKGQPATYISAFQIFCNKDGCLTRTGADIDSLTAWDESHLTGAGSAFLVAHLPIFGPATGR